MAPTDVVRRIRGGALTGELDQLTVAERAEAVLARAYALASSPLEGIDGAARELADLSGADVAVIATARRRILERLETSPDHATKQVVSLIRRALELGNWRWEMLETREVP
jgi:hypothetical protein